MMAAFAIGDSSSTAATVKHVLRTFISHTSKKEKETHRHIKSCHLSVRIDSL
jgi:hypothetical protein